MAAANKDVKVCWMTGNYTQRFNLIQQIKKAIGNHELFSFHEEDLLSFVLLQIEQYSCFGEKRLVILNGWPEFKGQKATAAKKLLSVLSTLTNDCFVILNNLKYDSKPFKDPINKIAKVYHFAESFSVPDASRLVITIFEDKDKSIGQDDASLLVSSVTPYFGKKVVDPDRLFLLIKKLEHFIGDRKRVQKEDVMGVCVADPIFIVWQLFPLLDAGNVSKAINLVQTAIDLTIDPRETVENILRPMIWRYRLLLLIREKNAQHASPDTIINDLRSFLKLQRKYKSMKFHTQMMPVDKQSVYSPDAIKMAILHSARYERGHLLSIYQALGEASLKIRSTNSDTEAIMCIESVIMLICKMGKIDTFSFLREEYRYV